MDRGALAATFPWVPHWMSMEDPGFGDGHFGDIAKWDHDMYSSLETLL